jgi:hypothetical protein
MNLKARDEALTKCAQLYKAAIVTSQGKGQNCKKGTLSKIIRQTENESGSLKGTIKYKTVVQRVQRNNLTGSAYSRMTPAGGLELVVVDYCQRVTLIGKPLKKNKYYLWQIH